MIDNGSPGGAVGRGLRGATTAPRSSGSTATSASRAPSTSAPRRAASEALVLLNDDCVCDPDFVERIIAPLDPGGRRRDGRGRDARLASPGADRHRRHGARPDPARLRLPERRAAVGARRDGRRPDRALGRGGRVRPRRRSSPSAASTSGCSPTGRTSTSSLRMLEAGGRCRLAPDARGVHEHSATLGSGSRAQELPDRLRPRLRAAQVGRPARRGGCRSILARDLVVLGGQAVIDRTVSGIGGRIRGWRAAAALTHPYPAAIAARGGASPYLPEPAATAAAASASCAGARAGLTRSAPGDRGELVEQLLRGPALGEQAGGAAPAADRSRARPATGTRRPCRCFSRRRSFEHHPERVAEVPALLRRGDDQRVRAGALTPSRSRSPRSASSSASPCRAPCGSARSAS